MVNMNRRDFCKVLGAAAVISWLGFLTAGVDDKRDESCTEGPQSATCITGTHYDHYLQRAQYPGYEPLVITFAKG